MPLITCHECSKEISTTATACPHCGAPRQAESQAAKWVIGILGGIAIGLIVLFFLLKKTLVIGIGG
jgi:hypothetical protein